jgi:hypothetical protein
MSRRGRVAPVVQNNGFMAAVSDNLRRLEKAVAYQTVKIEFTGLDVARWLLPPERLELLAAVFPILKDSDRTQYNGELAFFHSTDGEFGERLIKVNISVNFRALRIAAPATSAIKIQSCDGPIPVALAAIHDLHEQWITVHEVIEWLDENATIGAARTYFPVLTSLLPSTHAMHDTDGRRYKEPKVNVGPMVPKFRAAAMIIAAALLCPLEVPARSTVTAQFEGGHSLTFGLCE